MPLCVYAYDICTLHPPVMYAKYPSPALPSPYSLTLSSSQWIIAFDALEFVALLVLATDSI